MPIRFLVLLLVLMLFSPVAAQVSPDSNKPKFAITGDDQLCLGNPCTLSTAPVVTATWHVYALDNGNQPVGNAVTGTVGREVGKALGSQFGKFGKTLGGNLGASLGRGILGTFFK